MLNFTEKQLKEFEQWQAESLDQIYLMQQTIKMAMPREYSRNNFYLALDEIKDEFRSIVLKKNTICYKYEKITSELEAGACLQKIVSKEELLMTQSELFVAMFRRLEEIFGI